MRVPAYTSRRSCAGQRHPVHRDQQRQHGCQGTPGLLLSTCVLPCEATAGFRTGGSLWIRKRVLAHSSRTSAAASSVHERVRVSQFQCTLLGHVTAGPREEGLQAPGGVEEGWEGRLLTVGVGSRLPRSCADSAACVFCLACCLRQRLYAWFAWHHPAPHPMFQQSGGAGSSMSTAQLTGPRSPATPSTPVCDCEARRGATRALVVQFYTLTHANLGLS